MISLEVQIVLALILDAVFGDPRWIPHPVRFIGGLALGLEPWCRRFFINKRVAGIGAVVLVLGSTSAAGALLLTGAARIHPLAVDSASVLLLYFCFAARDLAGHGRAVQSALERKDLEAARVKVAMIVGRDTATLDEQGIVRAAVESVAENIVDGILAPLFWAVIAGPLGALVYKTINTLDSTFGYRNDQYREFGWAAARLDDLANFVPARLSGFFVIAAAFVLGRNGSQAWQVFRRDRLAHASPNSGHTEAAVAGALGLQLGGISLYFGKPVTKPVIGDSVDIPRADHIGGTIKLLWGATFMAVLCAIGIRLLVQNFY